MDDVLYLFFTPQRHHICTWFLQQKAISLCKYLAVLEAPYTFTASNFWLGRLKNHYGVCQLKISGEKFSAYKLPVNYVKTSLLENGYTLN